MKLELSSGGHESFVNMIRNAGAGWKLMVVHIFFIFFPLKKNTKILLKENDFVQCASFIISAWNDCPP